MVSHRSRLHIQKRTTLAIVAVLMSSAAGACSSLFQISPATDGGSTTAPKKTAGTAPKAVADSGKALPAKPVADKPAAKPVEKKTEKSAEKTPVNIGAKPVTIAQRPPAMVAPTVPAPPVLRRPEPIIEPPSVEPAPAGSDSLGVAHLMHAAAVWDAIRLFHPNASIQRMQWDNATVRRLTDIRSARLAQEYSNVMTEWLERLDDPMTRVELAKAVETTPVQTNASASAGVTLVPIIAPPIRGRKPAPPTDTTVVVTWPAGRLASDSAAWSSVRDATRNLQRAMRVVIDLRGAMTDRRNAVNADDARLLAVQSAQLEVANNLATVPAEGPGIRRRVYEAWSDTGAGWRVSDPLAAVKGTGLQFMTARHVAIIADSATALPPALLALVATRQAVLVGEGLLSDASLVPTVRITLGEGLSARVRVGELLNADGSTGIHADTLVAHAAGNDSSPALRVALQVASGTLSPHYRAPITGSANAELAYASWNAQHYPIMGARLLAAFKFWATLRTFHAYNDLRDEDLDETFARFIPQVEAARDADGYAAAMLNFASTTDDAQVTITSPSVTQHVGVASAPFRARWIEGRAIVTQLAGAAAATGLTVGDEISAADGYPMPAYINEHRNYSAASNDWSRMRNIMDMVPRGPVGESIVRVRDASNRERTLTLARTTEWANAIPRTERYTTAPWRDLSAGIGYIDLDRVSAQNIDSAFAALVSARAIVFDARTSRAPSALLLARTLQGVSTQPRVVTGKRSVRVATEPCVPADAFDSATSCAFERGLSDASISADTALRYRGKVVVLIDERTQGTLEAFALGMESAANAVFVGSPSAGASGLMSTLSLPGQLTVTFSNGELRHADGRQLQRVGLTPQIDVHPTVKGVRAGTDETLEAAVKYLTQLLDPVAARRKK